MPLTAKGEKIMSSMKEQYGSEKGEEVFYASKNKGTIAGVDMAKDDDGDLIIKHLSDDDRSRMDAVQNRLNAMHKRMKAYEAADAQARMDKGHWVAKTAIPAGGKIERKIKQSGARA
jgi:hypothetical protein